MQTHEQKVAMLKERYLIVKTKLELERIKTIKKKYTEVFRFRFL